MQMIGNVVIGKGRLLRDFIDLTAIMKKEISWFFKGYGK
jgi:hypothetical protein